MKIKLRLTNFTHSRVQKSVVLHTTLAKYVPFIVKTAKRTLVGRCRHHEYGEIMLASFLVGIESTDRKPKNY